MSPGPALAWEEEEEENRGSASPQVLPTPCAQGPRTLDAFTVDGCDRWFQQGHSSAGNCAGPIGSLQQHSRRALALAFGLLLGLVLLERGLCSPSPRPESWK